jgi:ribonuclease HI
MSEQIHPDIVRRVVTLYADGGVVGKNPSDIGGTWAWCGVDAEGTRIVGRGGFVPACGRPITNNHTEQIAITLALEAMPDGWSGTVCSDSMIALGRVFKGWREKNLPRNISARSASALARMGRIETVQLQGHPTKADLAVGVGKKRGYPVSVHNVWCDKECGRQADAYRSHTLTSEARPAQEQARA